MSRTEKIADTLAKYKMRWPNDIHRDLCREIADDLSLDATERQRFLHAAKAFES